MLRRYIGLRLPWITYTYRAAAVTHKTSLLTIGHRQHMQRMEALFNDFPFQSPNRAMLGLTNGSHARHNQPLMEAHRNNQLQPFGMFDNMFGSMFKNMRNMMADMQRGFTDVPSNPNGACYTQQSFVSYSKSGNEAPKVYQTSSSVRSGPGGIKETHKTVRDSESGVEKMAIGRHIHDRGHVMERSRNRRTGEEEQNQDFINMDEEDVPTFDREWREKIPTPSTQRPRGSRPVEHRSRGQRSQIPVRTSRLALPSPVTSETDSPRRVTDTRRHPESSRRAGQDGSKRVGQDGSKRVGQDRRVGFETRRTERRRATPRHRDRD